MNQELNENFVFSSYLTKHKYEQIHTVYVCVIHYFNVCLIFKICKHYFDICLKGKSLYFIIIYI